MILIVLDRKIDKYENCISDVKIWLLVKLAYMHFITNAIPMYNKLIAIEKLYVYVSYAFSEILSSITNQTTSRFLCHYKNLC